MSSTPSPGLGRKERWGFTLISGRVSLQETRVFCDVTKNHRRFAGHRHFEKRNVEKHHNERDVIKNM